MNSSFRLGSVLGITVRVHVLLLVLIGLMLVSAPDGWMAAFQVAALFGIVFLHELGHSIVAQSFGIRVLDITVWPLGGMARMSDIPESTKIEGLIAIAGPIVNFVLAALAASWLWFRGSAGSDPRMLEFARFMLQANILMGVFNLIPAFPTDGGRILRALLGRNGDWVRATVLAVFVGRVLAVLIGLAGLFLPTKNYLLPLIAIWLWWMGGQELIAVRLRHAQSPFSILADLARRAAEQRTAHAASASKEADFAPHMQPAPVAEPSAAAQRLSEQDIERLEKFRGRLRNYRPGQL